jgi:hypothetical protein
LPFIIPLHKHFAEMPYLQRWCLCGDDIFAGVPSLRRWGLYGDGAVFVEMCRLHSLILRRWCPMMSCSLSKYFCVWLLVWCHSGSHFYLNFVSLQQSCLNNAVLLVQRTPTSGQNLAVETDVLTV